jgi:hypothetical protein
MDHFLPVGVIKSRNPKSELVARMALMVVNSVGFPSQIVLAPTAASEIGYES